MSKFDLVQKISPIDLALAFFTKSKASPYQLIKEKLKIAQIWQPTYFSWGRNALYYLFKSLPYKKITFPAFTCPILTQAAERAGKKVILTEVNINTFNIDINKVSNNTECLVVVHTFGNPVNIQAIRKKISGIYIVEDCAHALFSQINGQFVGNQGDAILFSLYKQMPNINGAMLLTKEKLLKNQKQELGLKYLKRFFIKLKGIHQLYLNQKRRQYLPKIESQKLNHNKPCNLTFKLFERKFKYLQTEIERSQKLSKFYYVENKKSPYFDCQKVNSSGKSSFYQFPIRLKPELNNLREKIVKRLRDLNIFVDRLWYEAPIALPQYKKFQSRCPNALLLARAIINLPIYGGYTKKDVEFLFAALNKTIKNFVS